MGEGRLVNDKIKVIQVLVAGSVAVDLSCDITSSQNDGIAVQPKLYTSNPATIRQSLGGVGRNVASTLKYLQVEPRLCSVVGNDAAGSLVTEMLQDQGLATSGIRRLECDTHTAQYIAINDKNRELFLAVSDMEIMQKGTRTEGKRDEMSPFTDWLGCKPQWTVVDANWDPSTIFGWLQVAHASGSKTAFEPVSVAKARRIFECVSVDDDTRGLSIFPNNLIDLATPNARELRSMFDSAKDEGHFEREDWFRLINTMGLSGVGTRDKFEALTSADLVKEGLPQQSVQLLAFIPCIVTTLGNKGVLLTQILPSNDERLTSESAAPYVIPCRLDEGSAIGGIYMRLFPPVAGVAQGDLVSVNGVGDTFLGALIAGMIRAKQKRIEDLIDFAQTCAILTLKSTEAVNPAISSVNMSALNPTSL